MIEVKQKICEDQHERLVFGVRNMNGEIIMKICAAMSMRVGNTLFQKRKS